MTPAEARALDAADPLAPFRARFRLPEGLIYLDGNSLGPLPVATPARAADVVERQWGERLIASWNDPDWIDAPQRLGGKLARLLGAAPDEVIATGEPTSASLFELIVAGAELAPGAIVAEADNFPTDAYIASEAARLLGRDFRAVPGVELAGALAGASVAVVTHVNYRTGARHDVSAVNAAARAAGARIVWDLSHSAGAVPLDLVRDEAELAVGCTYKFLNGGPGAPSWLMIARGVIGDYREPGIARFGLTPLYTSHEDIWRAGQALADVMAGREWARDEHSRRNRVT